MRTRSSKRSDRNVRGTIDRSRTSNSLRVMAYGSQEVADGAWAPTVDPSVPELSFLGQPQWDLYSDAYAYRPRTALDDYSEAMGCASNPMPYTHLRECADAANTTVQEMIDRTVQMLHTLKPTKIGHLALAEFPPKCLDVPETQYSMRIWGGFQLEDLVHMDYFDKVRQVSVNQPRGYELWPETQLTRYWPNQPIKSFQAACAVDYDDLADIPEGQEWFLVYEGTCVTLKRDGAVLLQFQVPVLPRAGFAQFVLT
ncbi:hypothetical protein K466DRAFT_293708 [Polyporus arcularius HHB13444]|uniref:Uncharacterized protein n=1 Tax=Polyporus arcularius HHB13444 TaxID=1314778 RepID=A0A5C3PZZ8_9APHY|nr:hypothetical protein K466DRAFT_293708 [Polyporus arcularius HHB13444]